LKSSSFLALSTKVFRLENWPKHFTSSTVTFQSLKYFMVDWTSPNERVSLQFIQRKQSNSVKETVHFCKYSKHTLNKEEVSFINSSTSFFSPSFFPLLRISCVFNERTLLQFCVATFDKLTAIQSKPPILNFFPFQFPEFLYGTLTLWNVSATDTLPLTHFQRIFPVLLVD
jgi:hypothetical protein